MTNPEAVAWLESHSIKAQAARHVYREAGDDDPIFHTRLFSLKKDHEESNLSGVCYMCRQIRYPEHPTAHQLIVIDHD